MGYGNWSKDSYRSYSKTMGRKVTIDGVLDSSYRAEELYHAQRMDPALDPKGVTRECRDAEDHPESTPIILALDVTGSMGPCSAQIMKQLHPIMQSLYDSEKVKDAEIMCMGIGDFSCDHSPLQVSQYESDIRVAEQLDKIWLEGHGGGNGYESYSAAWYFALHHCDLDCWKRGKKGIIITMGDEGLNPYIAKEKIQQHIGDSLEKDVETDELYRAACEKYDIYHIAVNDSKCSYRRYEKDIKHSFGKLFDENHLRISSLDALANTIIEIVENSQSLVESDSPVIVPGGKSGGIPEICW